MALATSDRFTAEMARFYTTAAPAYDARHSGPWWRAVRQWEASAVRWLEPPLLDVGCGTGYWQRRLSRWHGQEVIGVDPSIGMLARNRAGPCLEAAAERLPFPAASFRGVSCMLTVLNTPTAGAALREIARVLKPGGRCAASIASIWDKEGKRWKRLRASGARAAFRLYSRQEFEALARRAGLRPLAFDSIFRSVRTPWVNAPMAAAQRRALRSERSLPAEGATAAPWRRELERGQIYSFVFEKPRRPGRRA